MKVQVVIELSHDEAVQLAGEAYRHGWQREKPRKRWNERELKEALRSAVPHIVREKL
jgi:ribulose kinase